VSIEVADNGEGIEPQSLERIFDAFEQVERSITRQFGGLGLGLTISKALVKLHDGTITADSRGKGQGATFTVCLPLLATSAIPMSRTAQDHAEARQPNASTRALRILVVEDHGDTARVMHRLLTAEGHQVETATDVATGLALARQRSFDLLLSDIGLPDGSGLDLLRSLREMGLTYPAIALTGYAQEKDIQACHDAGFAAHLPKPVNLHALEATIRQVTEATGPP